MTTDSDIIKGVNEVFVEEFEIPPDKVLPEANIFMDLGFDSLDVVDSHLRSDLLPSPRSDRFSLRWRTVLASIPEGHWERRSILIAMIPSAVPVKQQPSRRFGE